MVGREIIVGRTLELVLIACWPDSRGDSLQFGFLTNGEDSLSFKIYNLDDGGRPLPGPARFSAAAAMRALLRN